MINLGIILLRWISLLSLILLTQSCASAPEPRPQAILDAEYNLQQGTAAYYNDDYHAAANNFSNALNIYQSIDDRSGIINSYLNLIETAIAIGNLPLAQQQLQTIQGINDVKNNQPLQVKLTLLEVKLLFIEEQYEQALNKLQPLLPTFNTQQQLKNVDANTLNIVSSMARLSVLTKQNNASLWLQRLQLAIEQNDQFTPRHKALLFRLQALSKQRDGNLEQSKDLLNEALSIYHQQTYRRGIAASLQQLAQLEIQQEHWTEAESLLQRALKIHLWTLNQRDTIKVLEQLISINNRLGNNDVAQALNQQLDKFK